MPQYPQTNIAVDPSEADAHLAQLHKMSTTAGVTNLGYVAVNQTAVVALFLGIASALALLGSLLLVIPIVGIVFAVVAVRQIKGSSGTQTGRGMAIVGLALCVLLGGGQVVKEGIAFFSVNDDKNKIAATLAEAGNLIRDGKYENAYKLFDDDFQNRVQFPVFQRTWEGVQAPAPWGRLVSMEWNGIDPYFSSAQGSPIADVKVRLKFAKSQEERFDVTLRRVGAKWLILRFESFFPTKRQKPGGGDVFNLD